MANNQVKLSPTLRVYSIYASTARTATPDTQELNLIGGLDRRSAVFVLDVTAVGAPAPSLVLTIEGVDKTSGKTWPILTGAAVTTVSTNVYRLGPGLTPAANATVNDLLPPVIRFTVTHADGHSATYTLGANFG